MTIPRVLLYLCLLAGVAACDSEQAEPPRSPTPAEQPEPPLQAEPSQPPEQAASGAREPVAPSAPAQVPPPKAPAAEMTPAREEPAVPAKPKPVAPPKAPAPLAPPAPAKPTLPAEPEAPLDLSLPREVAEGFGLPSDPASLADEKGESPLALLPPLFKAKEAEQSSFELGGRLITNERPEEGGEGYLDAVEGAELQLRFRR